MKGWFPTLIGYSAQGFCKFGFYEIFKDVYATLAGKENYYNYRGLVRELAFDGCLLFVPEMMAMTDLAVGECKR